VCAQVIRCPRQPSPAASSDSLRDLARACVMYVTFDTRPHTYLSLTHFQDILTETQRTSWVSNYRAVYHC
jgi:hypothetical protein